MTPLDLSKVVSGGGFVEVAVAMLQSILGLRAAFNLKHSSAEGLRAAEEMLQSVVHLFFFLPSAKVSFVVGGKKRAVRGHAPMSA